MITFSRASVMKVRQSSSSVARGNPARSESAVQEHPSTHLQRMSGNQAALGLTAEPISPPREEDGDPYARCSSWALSRIPILPADRPAGPKSVRSRNSRVSAPIPAIIQRKLAVGEVSDPLEHEADRVADQVMRMPEHRLQRKCSCEGTCPECSKKDEIEPQQGTVRTKHIGPSGPVSTEAPSSVQEALRSPGRPLDPATRAYMEPRFGHDFSRVRIHTDPAARQSARDVNAHAYTAGHSIVFGSGQYRPGSAPGNRLIAHELTHVMQQEGKPLIVQRGPTGKEDLGTPTIGNIPDDKPNPLVNPVVLQRRNGKWYEFPPGKNRRRATGLYDFVVRGGQMWAVKGSKGGHTEAARGKRVVFAGSIRFNNRSALIEWNDGSGHFRPSPSFIHNINANLPPEAQLPVPSPENLRNVLQPPEGSSSPPQGEFRRHPDWNETSGPRSQMPVFQPPKDQVLLPRGRGGDAKRLGSAQVEPVPQKTTVQGEFHAKDTSAGGLPPGGAGPSTIVETPHEASPSEGSDTHAAQTNMAASPQRPTNEKNVETPSAEGGREAGTPSTAPLTEAAVKKELEELVGGRGRAIAGTIVRVGSRGFAVLKIAGELYMIYSLTQIRSLADLGAFAGTWAEGYVTAKIAGRVLGGSSPVAWLLVIVAGMPSDQGKAYQERDRRHTAIMKFLNQHFTKQEINANLSTMYPEAEKLLFETKPFELERASPIIEPLPSGRLDIKVPPPNYDYILMPLLERRFDPNDVSGYGARVAKVRDFFSKLQLQDAKRLEARLRARNTKDKLAEYFHNNLSTTTRNNLLRVLGDARP